MDISAACTPPIQPSVQSKYLNHPLYPKYQQYRAACAAQLVRASAIEPWLESMERTETHHVYQHCESKLWGWHILSKPYGKPDAPRQIAGERAQYQTEDEAQSKLDAWLAAR